MPNPSPTLYFPGISLSANNEIVFTTSNVSPGPATFPGLTNAEADPSSGDIREMAYAILTQISQRHAAAVPAPVHSVVSAGTQNASFPNYTKVITVKFNFEALGTEQLRNEPA